MIKWSFIVTFFLFRVLLICSVEYHPDSKVHRANMGPTWVLSAPDGPHVGPINLAIRTESSSRTLNDGLKQTSPNWQAILSIIFTLRDVTLTACISIRTLEVVFDVNTTRRDVVVITWTCTFKSCRIRKKIKKTRERGGVFKEIENVITIMVPYDNFFIVSDLDAFNDIILYFRLPYFHVSKLALFSI